MILIATQCFPPSSGGIEYLMYHLCNELARVGEKVEVFADTNHDVRQADFDSAQTFPLHRYGGLKSLRRRRKARAIQRLVAGAGVSVNCLLADTWKSIELVAVTQEIRTVCLAHGSELPSAPTPRKYHRIRRAYKRADVIVANSHYTAARLAKYNIKPEKIRVINPGIETPEPDHERVRVIKKNLANHFPILITVARLEQRKGHRQVIESLPLLKQSYPDILYLIVGDGTEREGLERLSRQLDVADNVCFTGIQQGSERDAYLASSNIFVMPGLINGDDVEGFGMAYIEAAHLGIPAIASDSGGSPEAVLHEQTGLVCAAGDQEQLVQALLRLASDTEFRTKLGESAHIHARDFLWKEKINEYLQVLHRKN